MADPFASLRGRRRTPLPPNPALDDDDDGGLSIEEETRLRLGLANTRLSPSLGDYGDDEEETGDRGFLRTAFEATTSPLRALTGLTGTSLVHALGVRALFPEQYGAAAGKLREDEERRAGPEFLEGVSALPGMGDVAVEALSPEFRESLAGRVVTPVTQIGLNILGDPTTYVGAGLLARIPQAGRMAAALARAQRGVESAKAAGRVDEAAEIASTIPTLAGRLAEAAGEETAVGRGARRVLESVEELGAPGATGRAVTETRLAPSFEAALRGAGRIGATLPFSPLAGVAYAPELVEGVVGAAGETLEAVKAGRYAEAAATGAGAVLTAGLGILVGKGVIGEAQAASALERAIAEQLGERRVTQPTAPTAPTAQPAAGAGAVERPGEGVTGEEAPIAAPTGAGAAVTAVEAPPVPPGVASTVPTGGGEGGGGVALPTAQPLVPPTQLQPTPGSERIQVPRTPEALQQLTTMVEGKALEGQYLTKRDLVEAGLVTRKQAKDYNLEALLDALGGTQMRGRLELVPGYGFRVRKEAGEAGIGAAAQPSQPGAQPAPPAAQALAAPTVQAVPAPAPVTAPVTAPDPAVLTALRGHGVSEDDIARMTPAVAQQTLDVLEGRPVVRKPKEGEEEEVSAPIEPIEPTEPPAPAPAVPAAPGAPSPVSRLTREEIDRQLAQPDVQALVQEALTTVSREAKKPLASLTRVDIAKSFPNDTDKATRALLNRSLEAQKRIARATAERAARERGTPPSAPQPAAALTMPGEARQPYRTISEGRAAGAAGIPPSRVRATITEEELARTTPPPPSAADVTELRAELAQIDTFTRARPDLVDEFAERRVELESTIEDAMERGLHLERTGPGPRADRPAATAPAPSEPYTPPIVESTPVATRAAIGKFLSESNVPVESFVRRAEDLIGKKLDDATGDELNLVLTMAERQPSAFGAPVPKTRLDPQLTDTATRRLTGGLEHLVGSSAREFRYDPASPAGQVQEYARAVEARYGIPAEQSMQDTMLRWISNLSADDERHVRQAAARVEALVSKSNAHAEKLEAEGKAIEAADLREATVERARTIMSRGQRRFESARNLRRLLLAEDPETSRRDLTRLLRTDVFNRTRDFARQEGKRTRPIDDLIQRSASSELTPEELARLAVRPTDEMAADEALKDVAPRPAVDIPPRPADLTPEAWLAKVRLDPELRLRTLGSIASIVQEERTPHVGRKGSPHAAAIRQLATDFGVVVNPKHGVAKIAAKLARAIHLPESPHAAAVSDLLTDALVAQRGPVWDRAVGRGIPLGDTGTRVVDFEDDAPGLARAFSAFAEPFVAPLSRITQDISLTTGLDSRFGGFTISPQLSGLRMTSGSIYVNVLQARHAASSELALSKLEGDALAAALDHSTARRIVDTVIHEIAHKKARHDVSTGDRDFISAYAQAIRDLGPMYSDFVRSVRDEAGAAYRNLGHLVDQFASATDALKEGAARVESGIRTPRADVGSGGGSTPSSPRGPGGGEGGALDRAVAGPRPGEPVPGGGGEAADVVRAGTPALESPAARGAGQGGGRGSAGPSASLTSSLSEALATRRRTAVMNEIQSRFAENYARYSGNPAIADRVLREIELLRSQPEELRESLRRAKPQGEVDIGFNLTKIPADVWSDEQREALAVALLAREAAQRVQGDPSSRTIPMTEADVRREMGRLIEHHTPEEFIDLAKLKGLRNPADFAFLRSIVATAGQDEDTARAMFRAAQISGDKDALAQAKEALSAGWAKKWAALSSLLPETTRLARALASLRMMAHPLTAEENFRSRFFGAMRASGIKKAKAEEFYTLLQDTLAQGPAADWTAFTTAFRRATQPRWHDKFLEFWKAGLLGIPTQIANIGTNALFLGLRNAENATASLANVLFSGLTGAPRTRFLGESSARMSGGKTGLLEAYDALRLDLRDIATLRTYDPTRRLSMGTFFDDPNLRQLYGAIGGKWGEFVRIPFKLLDSFDNFFKHIIRNQEWAAQSNKLAHDASLRSPGESVQHATARIYGELRRVAADPISNQSLFKKKGYADALVAGRNASVSDTFQEPLIGNPVREAAHSFQRATTQLPALQLLAPFVKTPYNIIAEGMKRTPLAVAWTIKKYAAGEIDDPAFVEAMVKSGLGTVLMLPVFEAALNGTITGSGPTDPKEQEILKRTGWQPRSLKLGDAYYSYQRLAPFSIVMGLAADLAEAYKRKDIDTASQLLEKIIQAGSENILDQSFITGIDSLVKILNDPQRQGLSAIRQLQASLIPNIVGVVPVAHAARAIDPLYRETEAFTLSPFQAQIPGASTLLEPQRTPTGEVRERKGHPLERLLSPIMRSEIESGPIAEAAAEIARVGPAISPPPLFFRTGPGGERVYYTPEEREEIAQAQELAVERVARLLPRADYQRLPDAEDLAHAGQRTKRDAIQEVLNKYRRPVTERINRAALRRAKVEGTGER